MTAIRWRRRQLSAVATALTASLVAAGFLAAWSPDPAAADTVVLDAQAAQILLPGGAVQAAHPGDTVPRGATVQTGPTGQATLATARRLTWLGAASAVRVDDGARQELAAGSVMVDARQAPGLALVTAAADLTITRGALVRVERGALLRVAQFAGSSSVVAHGRRASSTVVALHQVQLALGGLPGPVTALALTSDRWERALVADLVGEDADLSGLAAGMDAPGAAGQAVLAVLPAGMAALVPVQTGAPRSEETLAWGIAAARPSDGQAALPAALAGRYTQVRRLRNEGGSWAVVARLIGADVDGIDALLERLLEPAGAPAHRQDALAGPGGAAALLGPGGAATGPIGSGMGFSGPGPTDAGPSGAGRPGPATGAGTPSRPSPGSSPTPSPVLQAVVDTVVALLPSPLPTLLPTQLPGQLTGPRLPGGAPVSTPEIDALRAS